MLKTAKKSRLIFRIKKKKTPHWVVIVIHLSKVRLILYIDCLVYTYIIGLYIVYKIAFLLLVKLALIHAN